MKRLIPATLLMATLSFFLVTPNQALAQAPTVGDLEEVVVSINDFTVAQHQTVYNHFENNSQFKLDYVCVPAEVLVVDASNSGYSGQTAYTQLVNELTAAGIDAGNITVQPAFTLTDAKNQCGNTRGQ